MEESDQLKERLAKLTSENRLLKAELDNRFEKTSFDAKRRVEDEVRGRKSAEAQNAVLESRL